MENRPRPGKGRGGAGHRGASGQDSHDDRAATAEIQSLRSGDSGSRIFPATRERALHDQARREQRSGKFTLGLSRAIDLIDLQREVAT